MNLFGISFIETTMTLSLQPKLRKLYDTPLTTKVIKTGDRKQYRKDNNLAHGTIIQAELRCKRKPLVTIQIAGGLLLKELKYVQIILNIFEFFHVKEAVLLIYG